MKTFKLNNTEYTIRRCTAIAYCNFIEDEDIFSPDESKRQEALFVSNPAANESDEIIEYVVFGFAEPEDMHDFQNMCDEPNAWSSDWEVLDTVRFLE